jgi:O-antigen/teichoic acid export membrane protein
MSRPGIGSSLLWSTISSVGSQFITFITFAILARTLGTSAFGLVALATVIIDLLQVVSSAGIGEAVVQRHSLSEKDADTAFWANFVLGIFFFAIMLVAAPLIASAYHQPQLEHLVQALAFTFLLTPLGAIHTARLTRELRFKSIAGRNFMAAIVGAAVGIPMAFNGFEAWSLVAQRIASAVALVGSVWFAFPWRPRFHLDMARLGEFLGFGGNLCASQLLVQLNGKAAELISGFFLGPAAVGVMRAGARCIDMLNQLTFTPFQQIAMPIQARAQSDPGSRQSAYLELSRLSSFIMFPAFLGCFALADPIIHVVFGPEWREAADAVRILSLLVVALQINALVVSGLAAAGQSRAVLGWSATQTLLGIAAAFAVAPFGWRAMLAAHVARAYLLTPVGFFLLYRSLRLSPNQVFKTLRPAAISAVIMAGLIFFLTRQLQGVVPPILILMLMPPTGALIYVSLLFYQDRETLQRLITLVKARRAAA